MILLHVGLAVSAPSSIAMHHYLYCCTAFCNSSMSLTTVAPCHSTVMQAADGTAEEALQPLERLRLQLMDTVRLTEALHSKLSHLVSPQAIRIEMKASSVSCVTACFLSVHAQALLQGIFTRVIVAQPTHACSSHIMLGPEIASADEPS